MPGRMIAQESGQDRARAHLEPTVDAALGEQLHGEGPSYRIRNLLV